MYHHCKKLAQRNLYTFAPRVRALPDREKYTKEDLLTPSFLLEQKEGVSIYYAAHNEIINEQARVFIIGITPGWTQMERSTRIQSSSGCTDYSSWKSSRRCIETNECKRRTLFVRVSPSFWSKWPSPEAIGRAK